MIKKNDILSFLIFIEVLLSLYLIYSESQNYGFCIIGNTCESVQNTQYGFVFGIPVAWIGLVSFTILLLLFYLKYRHPIVRKLYYVAVLLGGLYALYLISIQAFVIQKFCTICMIIDPIMILITIISLSELKSKRNIPPHKR